MKRVSLAVMGVTGVFLLACGGAGEGSSTSGGGGNPVAGPNTVVEAVLAPGGIIPADPAAYVYVDPLNIQVGQNVVFQLASYSTSGARVILPTTSWRNSDDSSTFGRLGESTGLYQAGTQETTETQFVGTRYNGVDYFGAYAVKPVQGTITGMIVDQSSGQPLRGVRVEFYDNSGVRVGTVTQPVQGQFRASVPLSATQFTLSSDSIPASHRRSFLADGLGFRTDDPNCYGFLNTLVLGNNTMPTISVPRTTDAEPDLTGCSG